MLRCWPAPFGFPPVFFQFSGGVNDWLNAGGGARNSPRWALRNGEFACMFHLFQPFVPHDEFDSCTLYFREDLRCSLFSLLRSFSPYVHVSSFCRYVHQYSLQIREWSYMYAGTCQYLVHIARPRYANYVPAFLFHFQSLLCIYRARSPSPRSPFCGYAKVGACNFGDQAEQALF